RGDERVQGQIVLRAQGLVGAMEDACHSEGVEEEEKWGDIGACRHQPENRKVLTPALHRRHRPCRRLLKMPSAKGSRKAGDILATVCVCVSIAKIGEKDAIWGDWRERALGGMGRFWGERVAERETT
ncbi:MAG: hypothetical protein PVTTEEND_001128, partial [Candidatus Fervidibacter sp.]